MLLSLTKKLVTIKSVLWWFFVWVGLGFFLSLHHNKKINSGVLCAMPQII